MFLTVLFYLKNERPSLFTHRGTQLIGVLGLLFLIYSTAVRTRIKYSTDEKWAINSPVIDEETRNFWNWYHWDYGKTKASLAGIESYLLSIGIEPDDQVISLSDGSINISLYLMNRKGVYSFLAHEERRKYANFRSNGTHGKMDFVGSKILNCIR